MEKPSFMQNKPKRSVQEVLSGAAAPKRNPEIEPPRISRPKIANIDSLIKTPRPGDSARGGRINSALAIKLGINIPNPPTQPLPEPSKYINSRYEAKQQHGYSQDTVRISSSERRLIKKPGTVSEFPVDKGFEFNRMKLPKKMVFDFTASAHSKYAPVTVKKHKGIDWKQRSRILNSLKQGGVLMESLSHSTLFRINPVDSLSANTEQTLTQTHSDIIYLEASTQTAAIALRVSRGTEFPPKQGVIEDLEEPIIEKFQNGDAVRLRDKESKFLTAEQKSNGQKDVPKIIIKGTEEEEQQRYKVFLNKAVQALEVEMIKYRNKNGIKAEPLINVSGSHTSLAENIEDSESLTMHSLDSDGEFVVCANVPGSDGSTKMESKSRKTMITVWNTSDMTKAAYYLQLWEKVTFLRIHMPVSLVISGSNNGVLNIWSLREDPSDHIVHDDIIIHVPSIHTGCLDAPNHLTSINGIEIIPESSSSIQLITMDTSNTIICWSLLETIGPETIFPWCDHNTSWSNLKLRQRQIICLDQSFGPAAMLTLCLSAWEGENVHLLYGTNCGYVGKYTIAQVDTDNFCANFVGDMLDDALIRVHTLDVNPPFNLFLAAFDDKFCRLYDLTRRRSILSLDCVEFPIKVKWSKIRMSTFYVAMRTRIAIYDLIHSDMFPVKIYPADGLIDFNVAISNGEEHIVAITEKGKKLFLGQINYDLTPLSPALEKRFRLYLSIIH